jgi:acetyl esterase/lipase
MWAIAETGTGAREVPVRLLPVPDTISAGLRPVVGAPLPADWNVIPGTDAAWRAKAAHSGDGAEPILADIQERLGVDVASATIAGVHCYVATPKSLPARNTNRVLMHLHGGGYVLYPGLVGAGEAMLMAGYGGFKVVSVDYRMAPDFPFPAALDDAIAVWSALIADSDPQRMAIFGTSAGGGLTLATVLRARAEGTPLPAAIGPGSPWSDLTGDGDSAAANEFVDNVLVSNTGWAGAAGRLYAGSYDVRDPLISPIFGDFTGFPPAILTTGTRDLFLSDTVRTHRKLRQSGVEAYLQVFEAQSHAQFLTPFIDETEEAFGEIARFFDAHLAT